jgi:Bleomycin resistance protein-like N-terminal
MSDGSRENVVPRCGATNRMGAGMSNVEESSESAAGAPPVKTGEFKLEVVVLPVSDVDRAKKFYESLGWGLKKALERAAEAHGEHEKRTGQADPDWPDWYALYMVRERAGEELPR